MTPLRYLLTIRYRDGSEKHHFFTDEHEAKLAYYSVFDLEHVSTVTLAEIDIRPIHE